MDVKPFGDVKEEQHVRGNPFVDYELQCAQPEKDDAFGKGGKPELCQNLYPGNEERLIDIQSSMETECLEISVDSEQQKENNVLTSHRGYVLRQHLTSPPRECKIHPQQVSPKQRAVELPGQSSDPTPDEMLSRRDQEVYWQNHVLKLKSLSGFSESRFVTLNTPNHPLTMLLSPKPLAAVQGKQKSEQDQGAAGTIHDKLPSEFTQGLTNVSQMTPMINRLDESDVVKDRSSHRVSAEFGERISILDDQQRFAEGAIVVTCDDECREQGREGTSSLHSKIRSKQTEREHICATDSEPVSSQILTADIEELLNEVANSKVSSCQIRRDNDLETKVGEAVTQEDGNWHSGCRSNLTNQHVKEQCKEIELRLLRKNADLSPEEITTRHDKTWHQHLSHPINKDAVSNLINIPPKNQDKMNWNTFPYTGSPVRRNKKSEQGLRVEGKRDCAFSACTQELKHLFKESSFIAGRICDCLKDASSHDPCDELNDKSSSVDDQETYKDKVISNTCDDKGGKQRDGVNSILHANTQSEQADIDYICGTDTIFLPDETVSPEIAELLHEAWTPQKTGRRDKKEILKGTDISMGKEQCSNWRNNCKGQLPSQSARSLTLERTVSNPNEFLDSVRKEIFPGQDQVMPRHFSPPHNNEEWTKPSLFSQNSPNMPLNVLFSPRLAMAAKRRQESELKRKEDQTRFQSGRAPTNAPYDTWIETTRSPFCAGDVPINYGLLNTPCGLSGQVAVIKTHDVSASQTNHILKSDLSEPQVSSFKETVIRDSMLSQAVHRKDQNDDIFPMSTNRNNKSDDNGDKDSASRSKYDDTGSYNTAPRCLEELHAVSSANDTVSSEHASNKYKENDRNAAGSEGVVEEGVQRFTQTSERQTKGTISKDSSASKLGGKQSNLNENPNEANDAQGAKSKLEGEVISTVNDSNKQEGEMKEEAVADGSTDLHNKHDESRKTGVEDNEGELTLKENKEVTDERTISLIADPCGGEKTDRGAYLREFLAGCSFEIELDVVDLSDTEPSHDQHLHNQSKDMTKRKRSKKRDDCRGVRSQSQSPIHMPMPDHSVEGPPSYISRSSPPRSTRKSSRKSPTRMTTELPKEHKNSILSSPSPRSTRKSSRESLTPKTRELSRETTSEFSQPSSPRSTRKSSRKILTRKTRDLQQESTSDISIYPSLRSTRKSSHESPNRRTRELLQESISDISIPSSSSWRRPSAQSNPCRHKHKHAKESLSFISRSKSPKLSRNPTHGSLRQMSRESSQRPTHTQTRPTSSRLSEKPKSIYFESSQQHSLEPVFYSFTSSSQIPLQETPYSPESSVSSNSSYVASSISCRPSSPRPSPMSSRSPTQTTKELPSNFSIPISRKSTQKSTRKNPSRLTQEPLPESMSDISIPASPRSTQRSNRERSTQMSRELSPGTGSDISVPSSPRSTQRSHRERSTQMSRDLSPGTGSDIPVPSSPRSTQRSNRERSTQMSREFSPENMKHILSPSSSRSTRQRYISNEHSREPMSTSSRSQSQKLSRNPTHGSLRQISRESPKRPTYNQTQTTSSRSSERPTTIHFRQSHQHLLEEPECNSHTRSSDSPLQETPYSPQSSVSGYSAQGTSSIYSRKSSPRPSSIRSQGPTRTTRELSRDLTGRLSKASSPASSQASICVSPTRVTRERSRELASNFSLPSSQRSTLKSSRERPTRLTRGHSRESRSDISIPSSPRSTQRSSRERPTRTTRELTPETRSDISIPSSPRSTQRSSRERPTRMTRELLPETGSDISTPSSPRSTRQSTHSSPRRPSNGHSREPGSVSSRSQSQKLSRNPIHGGQRLTSREASQGHAYSRTRLSSSRPSQKPKHITFTSSCQELPEDPMNNSYITPSHRTLRETSCNRCKSPAVITNQLSPVLRDELFKGCSPISRKHLRDGMCASYTTVSTLPPRDPVDKNAILFEDIQLPQNLETYIHTPAVRTPLSSEFLTNSSTPRAICCPMPASPSAQDRSCCASIHGCGSSCNGPILCSRPILASSIMSPRTSNLSPWSATLLSCPRVVEMSVLKKWRTELGGCVGNNLCHSSTTSCLKQDPFRKC